MWQTARLHMRWQHQLLLKAKVSFKFSISIQQHKNVWFQEFWWILQLHVMVDDWIFPPFGWYPSSSLHWFLRSCKSFLMMRFGCHSQIRLLWFSSFPPCWCFYPTAANIPGTVKQKDTKKSFFSTFAVTTRRVISSSPLQLGREMLKRVFFLGGGWLFKRRWKK